MKRRSILLSSTICLLLSSSVSGAEPIRNVNPFYPAATPTTPPYKPGASLLEQYPLESLRLTAIVRAMDGTLFASVEDPHGIGSKVVPGTKLGNRGATVTEIREWGLVLGDQPETVGALKEIRLRED